MTRFEEILEKDGELTYFNIGTSMMPMLRPHRDVFTIEKRGNNRFKENDVILFELDGKYLLHRIVEVYDDHYTTIGDNCFSYEKNIKDHEILGILTSFQRNGKTYYSNDQKYLLYVLLVRAFEKPRILIKKRVFYWKKAIKSLMKKND